MFVDRVDAGRRLAGRLTHLRGQDVVVLGLPRGGVPVAAEVARALGAPLDIVLVRKLGVPFQPELAMGAISEGGVRVLSRDVLRDAGVTADELSAVETRERRELDRRAALYRSAREPVSVAGRVALVVDDGIATGSTARAACAVVRAAGARRVVLAVPVAPREWERRLAGVADEYVAVDTPGAFMSVGRHYEDFHQVSDGELLEALGVGLPPAVGGSDGDASTVAPAQQVEVGVGDVTLPGTLTVPAGATALVLFAHGSGSGRHSPRNRFVAGVLNGAGLATLLFDLLTPAEEQQRTNVFDVELLGARLDGATRWVRQRPDVGGLPVCYFGASTGAAAALVAAARPEADVAALVSRGGRPDLAGDVLADVRSPTLLIVGEADRAVLELNRAALSRLRCARQLVVVPGATHLFEEPGTLLAAAEAARAWFVDHTGR